MKIILYVLSEASSGDSFNQLAGIYLLNSLACQVDTELKMLVGSLGAVEQMLDIISEKLSEGSCDYVMENVWSTMWNVTDEAPVNCCRFLAGGGIDLFLQCKERFPDETPLLENMIGLLGNIAEVSELRPKLMTGQFVEEVASLHLMEEIIQDYTDKSQVKNWAVVVRSNVLNWQQSN